MVSITCPARAERTRALATNRPRWSRTVTAAGGTALPIPTDVADADRVEAAASRAEAELGPIDVWVNVAFTSVFAPAMEISAAEYRRVTEVDYLGYVYGTCAALRRMKPRNRGAVVRVGSALAYARHPPAERLLRLQARRPGLHRIPALELLHERSGVHVTMVQMPAVNTPQFSWVRSRLHKHAQPVPPIFQPEVAARAVLHAADHPQRREYWVGASTAVTLALNAIAPGLLDRYLARTGYGSQQTEQPRDPDQPENLFSPADDERGRDFGAHGVFDDPAHVHSPQVWASQHHGMLGGAASALAAGATAIGVVRRRRG
jgi:NAD(P)-dependent dehydrogenase (short-subunit alcohol dehydrogenase family)